MLELRKRWDTPRSARWREWDLCDSCDLWGLLSKMLRRKPEYFAHSQHD